MQTTFAATAVALAYLDKLVHDPRVGGWDYDTVNFPKMKGLEPALLVTLNDPMCLLVDPACAENEGGSDHEQLPGDNACTPHMPAGRFAPVSRTHEEAHAHDYPIPSPAAFGEHGYLYGRVALCASDGTQIPSTMFHEVGHYLDHNLGEYDGLSYPWGVTSDEPEGGELTGCCMDSYREGAALAETLGQLVVLYMYRRIYPGMDYTISGAAGPQGSCRLAELGIPETTIVHEDCLSNINGGNDPELLNPDLEVESMLRTFRDDLGFRPQASATGRCDWRTGYKIPSLFQAWWELLFAQECTGDGETLECVDYTGAPVDADYADRYMMALMWALKQGNNVGYVEFWDRMETFIANEFPGDLGLFQHVRDLHDIHPINADGAPVCAAGDPAGPG